MKRLGPRIDYIFVDDGSTDGSGLVLRDLAAKNKNIRIIESPRNQGLGMALRSAFATATGDVILTMDADLTFYPDQVRLLWGAYEPGVDLVGGSPYLGMMRSVPLWRRFLSHGANMIYKGLLGIPFTSASSIFRLNRTAALRKLELTSVNFDINAEILLKMLKNGGRVVEVPVTLTQRRYGQSKINTCREIKNHLKIFVAIFRWRTGL